MPRDDERWEERLNIQRQLGLCRALIDEFRTGVTARNLREIEIELVTRLRELDEPS